MTQNTGRAQCAHTPDPCNKAPQRTEDSADRRTELAANRTVLAAERIRPASYSSSCRGAEFKKLSANPFAPSAAR
jgi:hypothetical protein